jgi:hypothetical protein
MRRSLGQSALVLAVEIAIAGCGGSPSVHDLTQSARSWSATADFTAERWAHGAVSRKFAVVTFERASTELQQLATSAAQLRDTSAATGRAHAELTTQLARARAAVSAMDSAAAHGDRGRLTAPREQLGAAGARLDSLSSATEAP